MRKYIDSEAFFKVINTLPYKDTSYPDASVYNGAISDVADMLTHFPAADVAEVRHGRWVKDEFGSRCGACGLYAYRDKFDKPWESPYCPNCGAKMDDVEE